MPVGVETLAEDQFKLRADRLEAAITPRSKVLILCYPSNPTGGIMTYEDWLPIARIVEKHDLIVISDEIYAELTYGPRHVSFASMPGMKDRTILVSGFSKAFAMTGWRMGYVCGHPELIGAMLKIHQYTVMCAPIMGQIAALEALTNGLEEMERMVESYNQRRRLVVKGFREIGLDCHEPQGAFYAFPSIRSTGLDSEDIRGTAAHGGAGCRRAGQCVRSRRRRACPLFLRHVRRAADGSDRANRTIRRKTETGLIARPPDRSDPGNAAASQ